MKSQAEKRAERKRLLHADLPHVVRIVKRKAREAKAKGGTICSDNVWLAIEQGSVLPAFNDRQYRSALMGAATIQAVRDGAIAPAGYTRNRYGSLVRRWRAA